MSDSNVVLQKFSNLNLDTYNDGLGGTGNEDMKTKKRQLDDVEVSVVTAVNGHVDGVEYDTTKQKPPEKSTDEDEKKVVGLFQLFRFADKVDIFLMVVGTVSAVITGALYPCNLIIYGNIINRFIAVTVSSAVNQSSITNNTLTSSPSPPIAANLYDVVLSDIKWFCIFATVIGVTGVLQMLCWVFSAERQVNRMRQAFFHAVIQKHIGWFDVRQVGKLATILASGTMTVQDGISEKMATFIQWFSSFVSGYLIGFTTGWKLTLVIMAGAPILFVSAASMALVVRRMTVKEVEAYAKAGSIAEEVLSSIRTVVAFGGEQREVDRYSSSLLEAKRVGMRKGVFTGLGQGVVWMSLFFTFALAIWYGTRLIVTEGYTGGDLITILLVVLVGTRSLGNAMPNVESFTMARTSAAKLYEIIDAESEIDPFSKEGKTVEDTEGRIRFEDVCFSYPARKDVQVLKGVSFEVGAGQTVALFGPSGCGKSTSIQLLQRFYDPTSGNIFLDNDNVKDLNVGWLRRQLGVVSQEPVLFNTTIAENIRLGKTDATDKEIMSAAREANAHEFIMNLPEKYNTIVGESGAQLSRGQKQRIAIARALVKNPKVLLLDEATSALDSESEALVHDALENASHGRTTLIVAHRLSTVQKADVMVGINNGQVVETGTHRELMEAKGLYHSLVTQQGSKNVQVDEQGDQSVNDAFDKHHVGKSEPETTGKSTINMVTESEDSSDNVEDLPEVSLKWVMKMNSPEWPALAMGLILACISGAVWPMFAVVIGTVIGNFGNVNSVEMLSEINSLAAWTAGLGLISALILWLQTYCFAYTGECLTMRLRKMSFAAMLKQDISWHDDQKHSVGILTANLATDASKVKGAAGPQYGILCIAASSILTALCIAFIFGWKLALVVAAFMPFLVVAGLLHGKLVRGLSEKNKGAVAEGGKIATETFQNIRTVAGLGREDAFLKTHNRHYETAERDSLKGSVVFGVAYGFSAALLFFCYAASMAFGAWLVTRGQMTFTDVFRVFSAVTIGGMSVGRASSFLSDFGKAKLAAAKIYNLISSKPDIDPLNPEGVTPEDCKGELKFKDISFSYPSRPGVAVLEDFNLEVIPGQTVALVGSSGCGKSTTVQLIERFYDTTTGSLFLDDVRVKDMNIQWLRSQVGIVSQEPVLFDTSIKDNIAYGDNGRTVPITEIIEAAKKANVHNFVDSLPQGYDTIVGSKGTQLSGGQKQRIAIARALVRNPKILLLDEATSALDTESERIVQEALDNARQGRTCIIIAHRLSTIQGADSIAVIKQGKVTEFGNHKKLMEQNGFYAMLQDVQKHRTT